MDQPIETALALLQHDQIANKEMIARLANTTDRIGEVAAYVAKILAVHDERITSSEQTQETLNTMVEKRREETERQFKEVSSRVEQVERNLKKDLEETRDDILDAIHAHVQDQTAKWGETERRIRTLENWRWMLLGGGLVLGFIMGRMPAIAELVKSLAS